MQKKMDYKAPVVKVIYIVPEETICATSNKYRVYYPKEDIPTATHGMGDNQRYGEAGTMIWQ